MKPYQSVIITGASRGIGEHMVYECLRKGITSIVMIAREESELNRVKNHALSLTPNAQIVSLPLDLAAPSSADFIFERWPHIDLFIHNAALGAMGRFHDFDLERYEKMIRLNVEFTTRVTYLYSKQMRQRKRGTIFHIASVGGILPLPFQALYSATKSYMISLCEALDAEVQHEGVRVLAFCPGGTLTDFMKNSGFDVNVVESKKTFLASPESVARAALVALRKQQRTAASDWSNTAIILLTRWLPRGWTLALARKIYLGFLPK